MRSNDYEDPNLSHAMLIAAAMNDMFPGIKSGNRPNKKTDPAKKKQRKSQKNARKKNRKRK